MTNKIPNFFLRPGLSMHAYCSKCGKPILQDSYNCSLHIQNCSSGSRFLPGILNSSSYYYGLEKTRDNKLMFFIVQPEMVSNPRNPQHYSHGQWKCIYRAYFRPNSREVEEKNLTQHHLWDWLFLVYAGYVHFLYEDSPSDVISQVFPVVPDITNLVMFCHLYQMKGYTMKELSITDQELKSLCAPIPSENDTAGDLRIRNTVHVYGNYKEVKGVPVFVLRFYRSGLQTRDLVFDSIIIGDGILLSACGRTHADLKQIWNTRFDFHVEESELLRFDEKCPSFGLRNYLNGKGTNILIPLLAAGNYHKGSELLAKGGFSSFADSYFNHRGEAHLFESEPLPMDYRNASSLLGLPKTILRTHTSAELLSESCRKRIACIYQKERSLIEGIHLSRFVLHFLESQDVLHDHSVARNSIPGLSHLSHDELRRMIRFISTLSYEEYRYYEDYLHLCHVTHNYDYGLTPDDIRLSHDALSLQIREKTDEIREQSFRAAVSEYSHLSEIDDPDAACAVLCPHSTEDLIREGHQQHNCVASYIDRVINGTSFILFMRKAEEIDKPLITIEVRGSKLIQAKASCNRMADVKLQQEVCRWCIRKNISFASCPDISPEIKASINLF